MQVQLPYGKNTVQVDIPDGSTIAYPRDLPGVKDVDEEIRRAMAKPIGCHPCGRLPRASPMRLR